MKPNTHPQRLNEEVVSYIKINFTHQEFESSRTDWSTSQNLGLILQYNLHLSLYMFLLTFVTFLPLPALQRGEVFLIFGRGKEGEIAELGRERGKEGAQERAACESFGTRWGDKSGIQKGENDRHARERSWWRNGARESSSERGLISTKGEGRRRELGFFSEKGKSREKVRE